MAISKAIRRKAFEALYGAPKRSLTYRARTEYCIYVLSLKEHNGLIAKVGMTTKWKKRRIAYENWNLANGDALDDFTLFIINEEFVDLRSVEAFCLAEVRRSFTLKHGAEWFHGSLPQVRDTVRNALIKSNLVFEEI